VGKNLIGIRKKVEQVIDEKKLLEDFKNTFSDSVLNQTFGFGKYTLLEAIEEMIERQPKTDWIPCEERLPEEHDGIYAELIRRGFKCHHEKCSDVVEVTLKSKEGKIRTTNAMTYDGKWDVEWESKEVCHNRIEKVRTDETVIAWIPKREPYKKEGAENE
jgi:hypothetical protein